MIARYFCLISTFVIVCDLSHVMNRYDSLSANTNTFVEVTLRSFMHMYSILPMNQYICHWYFNTISVYCSLLGVKLSLSLCLSLYFLGRALSIFWNNSMMFTMNFNLYPTCIFTNQRFMYAFIDVSKESSNNFTMNISEFIRNFPLSHFSS